MFAATPSICSTLLYSIRLVCGNKQPTSGELPTQKATRKNEYTIKAMNYYMRYIE